MRKHALPIAVMFALFFAIAFVTGLPSPIGVIMAHQFHATVLQSHLGFFATFIAYALMGIPAGMLLRRIGYRLSALVGTVVGMAGIGGQFIAAEAGSMWCYLGGALVSGCSLCMLNTVVNPMLDALGGGGRGGNRLIQFGGAFNSLGATLAPMLVGLLMGEAAGRTLDKAAPVFVAALGVFIVVFAVLWRMRLPEPAMAERGSLRAPLRHRHFVLGTLAIFVYVGVEVGIPATAYLYMTSALGLSAPLAGSLAAAYWLLMLLGRIVGGALGARISPRTMLAVAAAAVAALVCGAILTPVSAVVSDVPVQILLLLACGLFTSVMWGGIFNLAVAGLGSAVPLASGIFMVMVCGGGILPLLQGWVADRAGYMASYWVVVGGALYMLWYALRGSKQ